MKSITLYATIKLQVKVIDDTSDSNIIDRIGSDCDYSIEHKDDVCEIIETEFIDLSTQSPI